MQVRPAAVAGSFYPGEAEALRHTLERLFRPLPKAGPGWPKAIIVPHAGYIYSGATAAQAYAQLAPGRGTIRRVVLLGPVHRVPVRGLALPGTDAFATPLGMVRIDAAAVADISQLSQVTVSTRAHAQEHAIEVQLPFLQQVLGEFELVPLAVGDATREQVAEVLEKLWGGAETVIVISSDLSHYHAYATAQAIDQNTVQAMLRCEATIDHRQACGAIPVNGLMLVAPRHGLQPRLLGLCNSGDTAGDKERVVGYASIAFQGARRAQPAPPATNEIPEDAGATLLPIARSAIARSVGQPQQAAESAAWLRTLGATFVTLKKGGQLRGCIGSLEARRTLLDDVKHNAVAAALNDPRFPKLLAQELEDLVVEVSLLSRPQPMLVANEQDALRQLRPGIDGLVLRWGAHRATFLPQVWEQVTKPAEFLAQLKRKAGLPLDFWADDVQLERYTVRKWSEDPAK